MNRFNNSIVSILFRYMYVSSENRLPLLFTNKMLGISGAIKVFRKFLLEIGGESMCFLTTTPQLASVGLKILIAEDYN